MLTCFIFYKCWTNVAIHSSTFQHHRPAENYRSGQTVTAGPSEGVVHQLRHFYQVHRKLYNSRCQGVSGILSGTTKYWFRKCLIQNSAFFLIGDNIGWSISSYQFLALLESACWPFRFCEEFAWWLNLKPQSLPTICECVLVDWSQPAGAELQNLSSLACQILANFRDLCHLH
jgi:hypothetical protein